MTWTFQPSPAELAHEPRYLLFTCRASGLTTTKGQYLLYGRDGSPGWRSYLRRHHLAADGQEHVYAIDLLSYSPPAPVESLALRIGPPTKGRGRLLLKMAFSDRVPDGATAITHAAAKTEQVRIEVEDFAWEPSQSWVPTRPPLSHATEKTAGGVRFAMKGAGKSMRWSAKRPEGIDVAKLPYVSVRYRARGRFGPGGYAFYLGVLDATGKRTSTYAMAPGNVEGDGRWHVFHRKLAARGVGSSIAAGIDSLDPEAELEIDYVEYSSQPPITPLSDILAFDARDGPWPAGRSGFTTVALPREARPPSHFMVPRMGIGSWFPTAHVTVEGIPFTVPAEPSGMLASGTVGEEALALDLPAGAREVLVLLAAAFPPDEMFGSNWRRPTPLRMLDEPERLVAELAYADGSSDAMLPIHAAKAAYGVGHGIAVYALHPTPGKAPTRLILRDRMRNASFGIVGVTVNAGKPRVPEPRIPKVWYPPVDDAPAADVKFVFEGEVGPTWSSISSPMLNGTVNLKGKPLFILRLGEEEIPASAWHVGMAPHDDKTVGIFARCDHKGLTLLALLIATRTARNEVLLELKLTNTSGKPVTGTLLFPCISGLSIGSVADTWYFCGRRGGVIHRVPCAWRDEIGEAHSLQVDGFFNPKLGAGVCFMPRDRKGVFRWYRVGKDATGGNYALEYLPQTVGPRETWECVPTVVKVVAGDWKAQLREYLAWVKTWYKPLAPRKPWFQKVWSFPSYCPARPLTTPVDERADLAAEAGRVAEALGACDYMHLFGWAITPEYGHWGDYDHFHQYGGKERFVQAVRRCQSKGIPVGLYLDGYLVHEKSQKPTKEQRERWAVRTQKGEMLYHGNYKAHSMCPYAEGWRDYLTAACKRVAEEIKPDGLYIDELGKSMVRRTCYAADHGHRVPMGMSPGEMLLARQIREAVPPEIATYTEYVPPDVFCQFVDGAFGHVPLYGHRDGYDAVAPHYVNLHRFAFPDVKIFELIYSVPLRNGNWFLLKYPFFNGEGYYLKGSRFLTDEHSRAFYRRVFAVQHAHADAFASQDVEPLVRTEAPHLFANRFATPSKTVWTLFNANYRTIRGKLLVVPHREGARYHDAWNGRPVDATVEKGKATLTFAVGPRAVGCVVQH